MIYFDNAATTPIHPEVIKTVTESMQTVYGNPSSTHSMGREAKSGVETVRKNIAKLFNVTAQEIVFTAGGSEADNLILYNAVHQLGVTTIITSAIEHHAILHTLDFLAKEFGIKVSYVSVLPNGKINYEHLEELLRENPEKKLVSLMFVNNEIGTLLDLKKTSDLCREYQAYFHSDTVQGIGHYTINLQETPVDFIAASAHKFHGPKGVGFAIIKKGIAFQPLLHGGEQEHGLRAGTENVHSIIGMGKALDLAYDALNKDRTHIENIKNQFVARLQESIPTIQFNAESNQSETNAYHILNVRFPDTLAMFLFKLDLKGIAASGGSACQSGNTKGSHVLKAILSPEESQKTSVRFSFSKFNTLEEVDEVVKEIVNLLQHPKL